MQSLRKRKGIKRILPLFLVFAMMIGNVYTFANVNISAERENLALNKDAFASSEETTTLTASKVTDGQIDREGAKTSRWACERHEQNPWVAIDFGAKTKFNEVVIEWERKNINSYKIETSDNRESWTTIYTGEKASAYRDIINVGEQDSRYVRVLVSGYSPSEEGSDISWETVSIYEIEVYRNQNVSKPEAGVNVALNKTTTASSVETNNFTANKATDGLVDRTGAKSSRWASAVSSDDQWLKVDLGENTQFENVVIEWERRNSPSYRIQVSEDDSTWIDIYTATSAPSNFRDVINLGEKVSGRYVRLYIDEHISNSEGVDWNTVSVYELEIYNGSAPEPPKTADEVARNLTINELTPEDTQLTMPTVPDGYGISFIGADYEEVIDYDMNIHKPLVNTKVVVNFEVTKGNEKATSPAIEVTVPGANEVTGNNKPIVVPELREWAGKTGNFEVTESSRIVVNPSSEANLRKAVEVFAKDYKDILGREIEVVTSNEPNSGDFYFELTSNYPELRKEGYYMDVNDVLRVQANEEQGIFLSTRTILQILKQNTTYIPKGLVRDYPQYDVRGFMLDVGRKFVSLEYLYEIMKTMSWYKLNDFQVHLNDNYIWLADDYGNEALENAYAAFRLESNDVGENGVKLTAQDGHYTKEEFGKFIDDSKLHGVNIVPEFDTPGHALAFTKVHPNYAYEDGNGENAAMLDVTNPKVVEYIKGIFNEYMDGENPVFRDSTIHIGTDEFYGNSEQYRKYADEMLKFIRDEKGSTPRLWGSLTRKNGSTPVTVEGVEMNIWNTGWANPKVMYDAGYKLINTDDAYLYIVPGANYYKNYLDIQWLYNNWEVNKFSNGTILPEGSPNMIGGMFALWNDLIDKRANGIVQYDIFDRIFPAIQVLSEKMWGEADDKNFNEFKEAANKVALAPNTNPKYKVESATEKVVEYDFENATGNIANDKSGNNYNTVSANNAEITNGSVNLNGENSYVKTPLKSIGPNYSISFSINRSAESNEEEQVIFESSEGSFKAVQKETGKLGFSREAYDYSFNYTLPKGEWVDITIVGKMNKTELYVNGEYVDEISKSSTANKFGTFVFPLEKIGSEEKSFKGSIDNLLVTNRASLEDPTKIPQEQMLATATSEHPNVGTEGLASFAIDGDETTIWHTNYNTSSPLPQSITLNLGGTYQVDRVSYLPRQSGGLNGNITGYELHVSTNGSDFTKVKEGTFENNASLKTIKLDTSAEATHVKLVATEGVGGFASAAELNVYKTKEVVDPSPDPSEVGFKVTANEEVKVGENFEIKVGTENLTSDNMYAMEFNVEYDRDKFEFTEGTSVDDSKYIVRAAEKDGKLKVIVATKGVSLENNEDVVKLVFKAKATGENVAFNIVDGKLADGEGNEHALGNALVTTNVKEEAINPNPEVNKRALEIAIEYADEVVANGGLVGVVPAVVNEFNTALIEARIVYENENATAEEVDKAFNRLMKAIHMLEFKQGDKTELQNLVNIIEALDKTLYTPETWANLETALAKANSVLADENAMTEEVNTTFDELMDAFNKLEKAVDKTELQKMVNTVEALDKTLYIPSTLEELEVALQKAKEVLANENATQKEVDKAFEDLVKAYGKIRLKPNKDMLNDLIKEVNNIDLSKYTQGSVAKLNKELSKAMEVLNNEEATQKDVDKAVKNLRKAKDNLVAKGDNSQGNQNNGNNNSGGNSNSGGSNSNGGNSNSTSGNKLNTIPQTGGMASAATVLVLGALASVAGVTMIKKRKN
ncbi:discoidin domain-containing protein [Clostridium septicum]|uniref:discoidin domain-containing protein n=1 Tax=Clostridium septicum TaxID=1504 RepID=UPI0008342223|nr:discoidin domain-containing protein [Clostridium septicum]